MIGFTKAVHGYFTYLANGKDIADSGMLPNGWLPHRLSPRGYNGVTGAMI